MPLLVQVSLHYRPIGGGQEVYIANLSRIVAAAGWETRVIQPYRGETGADTATVPRIPGVARLLPSFDEWQFACFAPMTRAALLNCADVILCHYAATAALIGRVPRWRRKTLVLSHGVEWNVDRMNLHDRIRERNARRLFGASTTVANDTDYLRRMGMSLPPGEGLFSEVAPGIWCIPNCVDTTHFRPEKTPAERNLDRPVILVPRQICEDRGIHLAIDAFALLALRRPGAKLLVTGPCRDAKYLKYCRSLVAHHGLMSRVQFTPPVMNEDMDKLYRAADVTLIPTLRREGTSLSALESMASGTPVVVTDVAGLRDLPAFRVAPTPTALADGLDAVLSNRTAEADRQGQQVRSQFNFETWAAAWVKVLDGRMDRRRA
ncbi:MAG: glycosyltransferase family 4 protein [bacterium]